MKVGIITIFDPVPNYGNKLQNYAVEKTFQKLNIDCETLVTEHQQSIYMLYFKRLLNAVTGYRLSKNQNFWIRCSMFYQFNKKHLHTSNSLLNGSLDTKKYDFFSIGSDQVWNPTWYNSNLKKNAYLLGFANNKQKVCFSPSFGISKLPEEWKEYFKEHLLSFSNISVREISGAKIIKELTGKDAKVLIDPTLMLDQNEWMSISKKPKNIDIGKKYILTYFLGELNDTHYRDIEKFAKQNELEIYNLLDKKSEFYKTGPSEFIYLISNASLICTDSYHACVFSFIFNRPFLIYERSSEGDMNSRIQTFLTKFKIDGKYANGMIPYKILEYNYENGYKILIYEREKVLEFLKESMKLI